MKKVKLSMKFFKEINELEPVEITPDMKINRKQLSEFMRIIIGDCGISPEGKEDFFKRFGITYLDSEYFRKLTDGICFLFLDGKYMGCFPTDGADCKEDDKYGSNAVERGDTLIVDMYTRVIKEYKESISKKKIIIHDNDPNKITEIYPYFNTEVF
jgi:hypothetical protein